MINQMAKSRRTKSAEAFPAQSRRRRLLLESLEPRWALSAMGTSLLARNDASQIVAPAKPHPVEQSPTMLDLARVTPSLASSDLHGAADRSSRASDDRGSAGANDRRLGQVEPSSEAISSATPRNAYPQRSLEMPVERPPRHEESSAFSLSTLVIVQLEIPPILIVAERAPGPAVSASPPKAQAAPPLNAILATARGAIANIAVARDAPAASAASEVNASSQANEPSVAAPAANAAPASTVSAATDRPNEVAARAAPAATVRPAADSADSGFVDIGGRRAATIALPAADGPVAEPEVTVPPSGDVDHAAPGAGQDAAAPPDRAIAGPSADSAIIASERAVSWAVDPAEGGLIALAAPVAPRDEAAPERGMGAPDAPIRRQRVAQLADHQAIPIDVALGMFQAFEIADDLDLPWTPSRSLQPKYATGPVASTLQNAAPLADVPPAPRRGMQWIGALTGAVGFGLLCNARREYAASRANRPNDRTPLTPPPMSLMAR